MAPLMEQPSDPNLCTTDEIVSVSVGADLAAWLVKSSGQVFRRKKGDPLWEEVPGARLTKVTASSYKEAIGISQDGHMCRFSNGSWSEGPLQLGSNACDSLMAIGMVREMLSVGRTRSQSSSHHARPVMRSAMAVCRNVSLDLLEGKQDAERDGQRLVQNVIKNTETNEKAACKSPL